jgi:glutamate-5-semialdehyde dehydrogenase
MVSDEFLPVLEGMAMEAGIELMTDIRSRSTLHGTEGYKDSHLKSADGKLIIVTVNSPEDAVKHIEKYGDGVCEGIYTTDDETAGYFCSAVDAGTVMLNSPLSHANGFDAGLGADVGLGADKLSGRGLFGLDKLTAIKYIVKR